MKFVKCDGFYCPQGGTVFPQCVLEEDRHIHTVPPPRETYIKTSMYSVYKLYECSCLSGAKFTVFEPFRGLDI